MAILFLGLLVGTLVYGLPTLASIFKMEKADSGCAVQLTMVVTFSFLIFLPLLSIGAGAVAVPALMWIGGCALLTWLPLAIMREKGFVLTNGKEVQCLSVLRTDSERIEK
jgi:hypothetical protein